MYWDLHNYTKKPRMVCVIRNLYKKHFSCFEIEYRAELAISITNVFPMYNAKDII